MALIVEDGSGLINANTYQDVATFDAYLASIGRTTTATVAQKEAALIVTATCILEYNYSYKSCITFPDTPQALSFPREELVTKNGVVIPSSGAGSIFTDLLKAQAELTFSQLTTSLTYQDDPTNQGAVIENTLDVMTQKYASPGTAVLVPMSQTVLNFVTRILTPYLSSGSNPFQGTNVAVV